jgi:hypothetical protein
LKPPTITTAQRAQAIIDSLRNKKAGYVWLELCKSPTAFIKTWVLGRDGRRLALLVSQSKKTEGKGASRGFVIARHALIALEKLARKVKSTGGQMLAEFLHFVFMLGLWAARAVSCVLDVPSRRRGRRNPDQAEFQLSIFSV